MIVNLAWSKITIEAAKVRGWKDLKRSVGAEKLAPLLSDHAVYVIRIMRPFSFLYQTDEHEGHSPVVYIGKGQFQQRITNHLKSWIPHLGKSIPGLQVEILFCEPRKRRLGTICEHVEADLLKEFYDYFGTLPLRNRRTEPLRGVHEYDRSQINAAIMPGRGKGFHWAIKPLPSSYFYREE